MNPSLGVASAGGSSAEFAGSPSIGGLKNGRWRDWSMH